MSRAGTLVGSGLFGLGTYTYSSRTNNPYPNYNALNNQLIGYAGNYGMGTYSLGGGYGNSSSWMTRPLQLSDVLLRRGAAGGVSGAGGVGGRSHPAYQSYGYGGINPAWWPAWRRGYQATQWRAGRPYYVAPRHAAPEWGGGAGAAYGGGVTSLNGSAATYAYAPRPGSIGAYYPSDYRPYFW